MPKMKTQQLIDLLGSKLGIPKWFHDAIFNAESNGGDPFIHDSSAGAIGPGQLMPGTARTLGVNPRDPAENILGSLRLQKQLLDKYRNMTGSEDKSYILAAAAYNAGEENVRKHGGVPPFAETQGYVRKVAKYIAANRPKSNEQPAPKKLPQMPSIGELRQQEDQVGTKTPETPGDTEGMIKPGNLDPYNRKIYKHPHDNGYGTTYSMSFEDEDGTNVLIPQIVDGRLLSQKQAINHYRKTGEHFGKFDTWQNADKYAEALHNSQDSYLRKTRPDLYQGDIKEPQTIDAGEGYSTPSGLFGKKPALLTVAKKGGYTPSNPIPTYPLLTPQEAETQRWAARDAKDKEQLHEAFSVGIHGFTSAIGSTIKAIGDSAAYLNEHPVLAMNPLGAVFETQEDKAATALTTLGTDIQQTMAESEAANPPKHLGQFSQSVIKGAGAAGFELPKLILGGEFLGAANLPLQGAMARSSEGTSGLVKGAGMGLVYHYGGGLTGKYLGKLGNSLVWIGGPAAEQHLVNGVPWSQAIGSSIPLGVFAGFSGSNRAMIRELATGEVRDAQVKDLVKLHGKNPSVELVEPEQAVQYGALNQARQRLSEGYYNWKNVIGQNPQAPSFMTEGGFVGKRVQSKEELSDLVERTSRLTGHPALRDGLDVTPTITAKNFFKQLNEAARKYMPEREKQAADAEDLYAQGQGKDAQMMSGMLVDQLAKGIPKFARQGIPDWRPEDNLAIRRSGGQEGFAALPNKAEEEPTKKSPFEKGIPRSKEADVVTLGAFHLEAGTASYEDWTGRMLKELGVPEDRMTVGLANQLGQIYARSHALVSNTRGPVFFSGLKQTIKELKAQDLIGKNINPDRLINLLKQRGQGEELKASGLEETLINWKKAIPDGKLTVDQVLEHLDLKGMTMGVMRGGTNPEFRGLDQIDFEEGNARKGVLPGQSTRAPYVNSGVHDYFEGVVHANKALDMSTDTTHFGFRPDQISWYRGGLLGDNPIVGEASNRYEVRSVGNHFGVFDTRYDSVIGDLGTNSTREMAQERVDTFNERENIRNFFPNQAILEEVQSKRNQLSRRYGVTEDPQNVHSQLVSLQRENDLLDKQAREIEQNLNISRWEPTDEYSRFSPDQYDNEGDRKEFLDKAMERIDSMQLQAESLKELDKIRAAINSNDHEINQLEHLTDTAPIPWSPHLTSWYEPALKGFLREAAERLEPDPDGNIRVTWTGATGQAERYSLKKLVDKVEWSKNEAWSQDDLREEKRVFNRPVPEGNITDTRSTPSWDVTIHFRWEAGLDAGLKIKTIHNLTERKLGDYFGDDIARKIVADEYDYTNVDAYVPNADEHGLNAKNLPVGGEWAVSLYGDTAENIKKGWPGNPNLLRFAWKNTGNEALVPGYFERYTKGMGGSIELNEQPTNLGPEADEVGMLELLETRPQLIIPEQLRQQILKGQLFFGKTLPVLPKGNALLRGIRNTAVPKEQAQAARTKLRLNKFGGQEGFLGFSKKAPLLDPRVKTDIADRTPEEQSLGSKLVRNILPSSPVRWMLANPDPRVDKIEEIIYNTKVHEHDYTIEWSRRFGAIVDELKTATWGGTKEKKFFGKKEQQARLQETFTKFIDLLEKPYETSVEAPSGRTHIVPNTERSSENPHIQRALTEYDSLTSDWKEYLMDSFKARGMHINGTPEDWGITGQGYFRHLFMGDTNLFVDGEFKGSNNYLDAVVAANKVMNDNPDAKVELKGRPIVYNDPALRVSSKNFERFVGSLVGKMNDAGEVNITGGEVRYAASGIIGKKENINKFFGAALKREGHEGYSQAFEDVTKMHMFQLARTQELSKLQKEVTPLLEELSREGKKAEVERIQQHLDDLWGKPLNYERTLGNIMKDVPLLRRQGIAPDQLPQMRVRQITGAWNLLKLKYNPKSILVNDLQPLRTLWPYLTTRDMIEVVRRLHDSQWKQTMADLGIMKGTTKLETTDNQVQRLGFLHALKDPFTYISGLNRIRGYTAGIVMGERAGLSGFELHKVGLRWADQVEFDNSKWNAPSILRHSAGQLFGQYKGFMIKDIENSIDIFQGNNKYKQTRLHLPEDVPYRTRPARAAKWAVGTAAFGGVRAAASPFAWMGTAAGYSAYLGTAALIKATTGASDKDSKFMASLTFLGAPAGAGVDLSSSLTTLDEPTGVNAWEQGGRFFAGPTATFAYDMATRGYRIVNPAKSDTRTTGERIFDTATKATPYARMGQRVWQAGDWALSGQQPTISIDQHRTPLTGIQTAAGIFGIPPASQTLYYEEKSATGQSPFAGFPLSPFNTPFQGKNSFGTKPFKRLPKK